MSAFGGIVALGFRGWEEFRELFEIVLHLHKFAALG
jgi:hypothetical protein